MNRAGGGMSVSAQGYSVGYNFASRNEKKLESSFFDSGSVGVDG